MLTIKFRRIGKKKQASYRLVVSERGSKLQGRHREDLGWYNPHSKETGFKDDRIKYWLSAGAQPSNTVHNLFVNKGVIDAKKVSVHSQSKKVQEEAPATKPEETESSPAPEVKAEEVATEEKKEEAKTETVATEEKKEEPLKAEDKKDTDKSE